MNDEAAALRETFVTNFLRSPPMPGVTRAHIERAIPDPPEIRALRDDYRKVFIKGEAAEPYFERSFAQWLRLEIIERIQIELKTDAALRLIPSPNWPLS